MKLFVLINLGNATITADETVKLLAIHLDDNINFNRQIEEVGRKAESRMNFLLRLALVNFWMVYVIVRQPFVLEGQTGCQEIDSGPHVHYISLPQYFEAQNGLYVCLVWYIYNQGSKLTLVR